MNHVGIGSNPSLALSNTGSEPLAILSLQGKKGDEIWTWYQWTKLCEHLHNENPDTAFVMGFRSKATGTLEYKRSRMVRVRKAISWAFGTIEGKAKSKLAYVPYSTNQQQQSRWGALDFDVHEETELCGQERRTEAREFAFRAFRLLLNAPELFIILESSGSGGWHVWAISKEFHPVLEWRRTLKSVALAIGAKIESGTCEIFPPDTLPDHFGKGVRAPGCWNPRTDAFSGIHWENCRELLASLSVNSCLLAPSRFTDKEKNILFSAADLYKEWPRQWSERFSITNKSTRNEKVVQLVSEIFHQVGREMMQRIVRAQFREKKVRTNATEREHLHYASEHFSNMEKKWLETLDRGERSKFDQLSTDNERDAFRIIRSFWGKSKVDGVSDFPVAVLNLGERIAISKQWAYELREKFVKLGILRRTALALPNQAAARFAWTADCI